jgi:hypothetical protein
VSKFSVVILQRETHQHAACFEEVAKALSSSLRDLGHETVDVGQGGRLIVFGANNAIPIENGIPDDAIIFNTEQMTFFGGRIRTQMQSFDRWKKHIIWDYSQENARRLREAGADRVIHCPIGYHPRMRYIEPAVKEDIDILFYGSVNPRRRQVLEALHDAGHKVVVLFGAYGKERDDAIARSKIVLNVHAMEESIWEIFRVSHLLANSRCVVSESGSKDDELEAFARKATTCVPLGEMVDACDYLLREGRRGDESRAERAARGFLEFSKTSFVDNVKHALTQS